MINISEETLKSLCCPICKSKLKISNKDLICMDPFCKSLFPIINGIPILINESNSIFSMEQYRNRVDIYYKKHSTLYSKLISLLPSISQNLKAHENYEKFCTILLKYAKRPRVLVLGGGILGKGMQVLLKENIELIESDISLDAPRTQIVIDAHDIPFEDETFDGIVAQAVLEHVIDPYRCVNEIYRVLKRIGIVYAEIPFMQQRHLRRYDFTRLTYLGVRRLFKGFNDISSGACCGPGMALAWSIKYFLMSFTKNKIMRKVIDLLTNIILFPLKYFDYLLIDKPNTLDAASAFYFLGSKRDSILKDSEIVELYRGAS